MFYAILPFIWFFFGIATAIAASNKGRSGFLWFIIGALIGPFGLLLVLVSSGKKAQTLVKQQTEQPIKKNIKEKEISPILFFGLIIAIMIIFGWIMSLFNI